MTSVTIPSNTSFTNLYTLSGYPSGTSLVLTNGTAASAYVVQSATQPDSSSHQYPLMPGQTILVNATENPIWIKGSEGPFFVQSIIDTIIPFTGIDLPEDRFTTINGSSFLKVELPSDIYTSSITGYRRLRVDPGQTSFFLGKQFRLFKELSIPSGGTYVIRFNVNVNTVLFDLELVMDASSVKLETITGGTAGGTFTPMTTVVNKNTMSSRPTPLYTMQNTVADGGTLMGGTVIDVIRVITPNSTAQQQSVGNAPFSERGAGAGTYYWKFTNIGNSTATGVFRIFWEER